MGSKISCLSLNVSEGKLWCLPAKPAFLLCDGSTTENREQTTADRLALEMLLFKNLRTSRKFQKQLLQFFLLNRRIVEITEMSATLRWASGRGPRNVTFKSVRPPDRATGRWDKVLELLLIKNLHTSRNFQQLQRFSIKSTNRRNY